jgi:hypothetical protein
MTNIVDPYKIKKYRIEINKIEITPYRVDIKISKFKRVDQVVNDELWFTDEEGNLTPDEIGELYWILFINPEYQKIIGIYYDERLVAFQVIANDNLHYITWDTDGVMVSNCLEGVEYGKEMLKNE